MTISTFETANPPDNDLSSSNSLLIRSNSERQNRSKSAAYALTEIPSKHAAKPNSVNEPEGVSSNLHVICWEDPLLAKVGFDPRSKYVELFWLPVLGPSSTWLLRRIANQLDLQPQGFDLNLEEMAHSIGLGGATGRHSPLIRSIKRCVRYGAARRMRSGSVAVRKMLSQIPQRYLERLPQDLQSQHQVWALSNRDLTTPSTRCRRTRLEAIELLMSGTDPSNLESILHERNIHPALAFDAARWARTKLLPLEG